VRQSNAYIIIFSTITTVLVGGLLATASQVLKPAQERSMELDTKRQILGAVMQLKPGDDVLKIFDDRISSLIVNYKGEEIVRTSNTGDTILAEDLNLGREFKAAPEERAFPVFIFHKEGSDEVEAYIFPVYGRGLWDNIWGYIALETDLKTIKGARFDHAGETPGLGARITEGEIQNRFIGKKMYDNAGQFVSVRMLKGERNPSDKLDEHHVDGLSGATLTTKGVNEMIQNYFGYYDAYIQKLKNQTAS